MDGDACTGYEHAGRALEHDLAMRLNALDSMQLRLEYWRRDELAIVDDFLDGTVLARIAAEARSLRPRVKRRSVFGYKASGSLSHHVLAQQAPTVMALYRSSALRRWLSDLAEQPLVQCPDWDPHAVAVYCYDAPGDRVGFHYDTSHYRGARYTVLIGIEDDSSARLLCRVRARERHRATECLDVRTGTGNLVFFNGDKLLHAVSPIASGELRVVVSLQFVTNPSMHPLRRAVSLVKDSLAYFGSDAFVR